MNVTSRRQRVGTLLLRVPAAIRHSLRAVADALLARLLHGRQLKLLVVEVVRFFTSVAFSVARKLFIQMDALGALSLARNKGTPIRLHAYIESCVVVGLGTRLLASGDHVAAHVKRRVLGASLWA